MVILALVAAQAADFLTFVPMVERFGIGAEMNPLVVYLYSHGLPTLAFFKIVTTLYGVLVYVVVVPTHPRLGRLVIGFGILLGSIGALSNVLTYFA